MRKHTMYHCVKVLFKVIKQTRVENRTYPIVRIRSLWCIHELKGWKSHQPLDRNSRTCEFSMDKIDMTWGKTPTVRAESVTRPLWRNSFSSRHNVSPRRHTIIEKIHPSTFHPFPFPINAVTAAWELIQTQTLVSALPLHLRHLKRKYKIVKKKNATSDQETELNR